MSARARRCLFVVARIITNGALFVALGCMHWAGVAVNPVPGASTTLRLHLRDGSSVIVREAVVSADSIAGTPWGSVPKGSKVSVARAQVERVEVGELDPLRTSGLILVILAVPVGTLVWVVRHFRDP
jgi:hypothetical protein